MIGIYENVHEEFIPNIPRYQSHASCDFFYKYVSENYRTIL